MKYLLFIVGTCAALYGVLMWFNAQSAVHQGVAVGMFTVASVLASGGAIVEAIEKLGGVTRLATAQSSLASLNAAAAVSKATKSAP